MVETSLDTRNSQIIVMILLATLALNACSPQPTAVPTSVPPPTVTRVPASPTVVLPTATSTSEPPVPVTSLDQIVGIWLTHCGSGPCTLELGADGTYRMRYVKATEGQGVTSIDSGKITFADGIFHLESTIGYCTEYENPHGYYQASLAFLDGKPYELVFMPAELSDKCDGRYRAMQFPMHVFDQ